MKRIAKITKVPNFREHFSQLEIFQNILRNENLEKNRR